MSTIIVFDKDFYVTRFMKACEEGNQKYIDSLIKRGKIHRVKSKGFTIVD